MAVLLPTKIIFQNTLWNLLGSLLPVPAALLCIPILVSSLGLERFGVLGIAWTVMAYFGLFDFGLSQSTTRFVAKEIEHGRLDTVQGLVLGSLLLHGMLGIFGGGLFSLLVSWLTEHAFSMPSGLVPETKQALYWLAASIPAIVITSALRGTLEGLQRFDLVNLVRVPAGIFNYVAPVIALMFGNSLPLVVAVIVITRYAVLGAYALACFRTIPQGSWKIGVHRTRLTELAAFGGWLTASNVFNPLIVAADRFIIAAAVSIAAVTFYVTPYEVITKIWIFSASLMGAMFPVLSALSAKEPSAIRAACRTAEMHLVCLTAPAVALILGCADWMLGAWLGTEFREGSTAVAHWLAVGVLLNVVAQVPLTALHAIGRADVTARIVAAELPFYVVAAWYCASAYGVVGVAMAWAARAAVDAVVLFGCAHAILPKSAVGDRAITIAIPDAVILALLLGLFWTTGIVWRDNLPARTASLSLLLAVMLAWEWLRLLTPHNRDELRRIWSQLIGTKGAS